MLAEARREAELIIGQARELEQQLISDGEVTERAERGAEDITEVARGRAHGILLGAEDYADKMLDTLEVNLSKFNAAVQRGRDRASRGTTRSAERG
jgi:cell division septum initiation protein DivIVA